jgi:hypothetical protein
VRATWWPGTDRTRAAQASRFGASTLNVLTTFRTMPPRIILHIDMDAFYATVLENENPALRQLPLGVQQKGLLATCNYVARTRGVKKLQPISDARKVCKDLVIVNGEDLTRYA